MISLLINLGELMQEEYVIEIQTDLNLSDMSVIVNGLTEYNASKTNGEMPSYLVITVRDQMQNLTGGLLGATYLGWLQVHAVWLSDALRGRGYGTRLMRQAEEEAQRRGCPRVFLETLSFQALPFYEKLGYTVISQVADFPPGGTRYALTKILST
jgi:ribosomal protein S18 acetylase RimI-like enzyme